jgi:dienelactone hydrolase
MHTSSIEYFDGTQKLRGFLAMPTDGGAKRPGVLVAPEWWGLNEYVKRRAVQLADMGYVAFAIDMYGDGKTTTEAATAEAWARTTRTGALARKRASCAFRLLQSHPAVCPTRVGAAGFCFGGSVVLELARGGAELRGVASFHGSLATPSPAQSHTLKASILVLHGGDDRFISDDELIEFQREMRNAKADWQVLIFGNAVHSFSNSDADAANIPGVAYHELTDRRAWSAFERFLEQVLKE